MSDGLNEGRMQIVFLDFVKWYFVLSFYLFDLFKFYF
jgi:hypothetical protein